MIRNIDESLNHINISTNQTIFQQCQKMIEVQVMSDFNEAVLQHIAKENAGLFNQLLRVLSLYNLTFDGFQSRLNICVPSEETFSFNSDAALDGVFKHGQFKRIVHNLGFLTKDSLHGVNIEKLVTYASRYLPREIIVSELQNLTVEHKPVSADKRVKFLDKYMLFSASQLNMSIQITDTALKIVNQYFTDDGIHTVAHLPEDLDTYFSAKTGVGIGKKEKLLAYFEKIENGLYDAAPATESGPMLMKKFKDGELLINNTLYQIPAKYVERAIESDCFTPTIAKYFEDEGITLFKQLKGNIGEQLQHTPKLGKKKIDQFLQFLVSLTADSHDQKAVQDFQQFVKRICEEDVTLQFDERNLQIFLSRYKHFEGGSVTLENVASDFGITRERIRQIVKKIASNMVTHMYWIWIELRDYTASTAYFSVHDIDALFDTSFTPKEHRFIGAILSELGNGWKYEEEGFYHQASSEDVQMMKGIIKIEVEQLFASKQYVNHEDIKQLLAEIQQQYPTVPVQFIWENSDSKQLVIEGKTNLFLKASLEEMAYKVYCMYFKDGLLLPKEADQLIHILKDELPGIQFNFTARSITNYIQRTAYLWNRGYYVPKAKVESYKREQFNEIIESIEQHLKENNLMEMSINLIFESYEEQLASIGIDSYYALYTVLKFLEPSTIHFRKVPYIRLIEHANSEHITQVEQIEEYFLQAEKPLNRANAFEYFTKTVGMPSYSFEQRLTLECHNIVQFNANEFVHIENLEVDEEKLAAIVTQLNKEVEKFDVPIPITIIKKALLRRAKIHSYHLLFSLIKHYYPEEFTYYRYPQITRKEVVKLGHVSLRSQLEKYLLEQGKVVFISQINSHFTNYGWTTNEISNRFSLAEVILPIEKGAMYAHRDILGLTDTHIDKLAQAVFDYYVEKKENEEAFFIAVNENLLYLLQQEIEFPKLHDEQLWTVDLLKAVLKISGRFFTPFMKDTVLFARENKYGLDDIESIIVHILNAVFEGKTTVVKLQQWLIANEIMTHKYFKRILEEEDAQYEHDGIIISVRQ